MITRIENYIVDLISGSEICKHLRDVKGLPDLPDADKIKQIALMSPAVYVIIDNYMPYQDTNESMTIDAKLLVLSSNSRGFDDARHGDGQTIGMYQIADFLTKFFNPHLSRDSDIRVQFKKWQSISHSAFRDAGLCASYIDLDVCVSADYLLDTPTLDDFKIFSAAGDLPPHINADDKQAWLQEPADYTSTKPDFIDIVELQ